jgi:hypothetical protein
MESADRSHGRTTDGCRLQLEAESAAEALSQCETPCAIDSAAERGMEDELHSAGLVEEALGHDFRLGRYRTEYSLPLLRGIVEVR